MENGKYLAFLLPAFFLFLFIEIRIAKYKNKHNLFLYESSVNNISIGIAERLLSLFITSSFYSIFYYIHKHYAIFNIPNTWYIWILLILATDLVWYWYHRLGHEINILWAAHIVHHQSEEFNLTVAARITIFQAFIRNIFWCVLPLVGFPPSLVIFILLLHGIYSFFTHTQVVGKLGWLEYIFITPSLHGVHHASNDKYLDKNYGDIFIFWDKMFGTFARENEKPKYGLTHPIQSYSFIWQHFHYYVEIWEAVKQSRGLKNKLSMIFGKPAIMSQHIRPLVEKKWNIKSEIATASKVNKFITNIYLTLSFVTLCYYTFQFNDLTFSNRLSIALLILITLSICGGLIENKKWVKKAIPMQWLLIVCYLLYRLLYQ